MFDFDELAKNLPDLPTRKEAAEATGYSPGYLANLDSRSEGIPERLRIGRKIHYTRAAVIKFLRARCSEHIVNPEADGK